MESRKEAPGEYLLYFFLILAVDEVAGSGDGWEGGKGGGEVVEEGGGPGRQLEGGLDQQHLQMKLRGPRDQPERTGQHKGNQVYRKMRPL